MDDYLNKKRFNSYFAVNAKSEAARLRSYASTLSSRYLKDFSTRLRFMDEMDKFIESQIKGIASAPNEKDCEQCLFNLREEKRLLEKQETSLFLKSAKLVVSAELVNKMDTWGYIINGIGVILGAGQVIAGAGIMGGALAHANVIAFTAGALLVLHGYNSVIESANNIYTSNNNSVGKVRSGYISVAHFMGFDDKIGSMAYSSMDLVLSGYGMARLILKPNAWRLFQYMPSDYVRNFRTMSTPSLFMEGVGDVISLKSGYDNIR